MLGRLFLAFTLVTLVELALLIKLGALMGLFWTIVLIAATGFLGAWLAREQGIRVLQNMQAEVQQLRVPTDSLMDGALVLIAGAFLLTPGVLTDLAGFLLLVPGVRAPVKSEVRRRVQRAIDEGRIHVASSGGFPGGFGPPPGGPAPRGGHRRGEVVDVTRERSGDPED